MATEYTGNPGTAQAPSPVPSLGSDSAGDPVGNLPADGDSLNASSVAQAMKVPMDWIALFRRTLAPYKGVRTWDSGTAYVQYDLVQAAGVVYQAVTSSTNRSVGDPTYWTPCYITAAQITALMQSLSYGVSVDTSATDISSTHGTLVSLSVLFTTIGYSTLVKRLCFRLAFSSDGTATVTLSGAKEFTKINSVQVTGSVAAVTLAAVVTGASTFTVESSGVGGPGVSICVVVDGY
jgi:hypothetical protein